MSAVTVCIPTYNGARFVREAIESVLDQTFTDFDLVINDDCSSDETMDVVGSISDPRIRLTRNSERLGLTGNWNRCIELSASPYVLVFHQDDVMASRYLAEVTHALELYPSAAFVFTNIEVIDDRGVHIGQHWNPILPASDAFFHGPELVRLLAMHGNVVPCQTVMMRSASLKEAGSFDRQLRYTPDLAMWLRLAQCGEVAYLAAPLIKLRRHSGQESRHHLGRPSEIAEVWRAFQIGLRGYSDAPPDGSLVQRLLLRHLASWSSQQLRASLRSGKFGPALSFAWQAAYFQARRGACLIQRSRRGISGVSPA